jgi:hypothetical protein
MPDKDGDEGKSTKSVVNKKQKQMMGEEGYDIARDMGRVRPSKDKKDATTMPPSKEMEKTRKVNKGPSALDIVKKKYKGQIMKMEELDLTKVAESFGGYVTEAKIVSKGDEPNIETIAKQLQKKGKIDPEAVSSGNKRIIGKKYKRRGRTSLFGNVPKKDRLDPDNKALQAKIEAEAERRTKIGSQQKPQDFSDQPLTDTSAGERKIDTKGLKRDPDTGEVIANPLEPRSTPGETQLKGVQDKDLKKLIKRKPRTIPFKDRKQLDTETQKKVDAVTPPFATKQGETGPLPVSMRNRRVPKTSSLSPNVKVTSIVKPKVGALTQTDFNKIVPFRRPTKTYNDFINPEIVDPGGSKPEKGEPIGKDTGRTVDAKFTVIPDKPPEIKGFKFLDTSDRPTGERQSKDEPKTQTDKGGDPPKKNVKVGTATPGKGPFSRVRAFARRNPVVSLIGYDALKNLRVPSVTKPTKTGRVSAGT